MRLAVFISGGGSNFKAIARAIAEHRLDADIALVAANNPDAPGLDAARGLGYATDVFDRNAFPDGERFAEYVLNSLSNNGADFISLAGYLRRIPPRVVKEYHGRIVNIHPALLPRFGGKGMFGLHVHQAVIDSGVPESGVTIHYVDEVYDHGVIIAQRRVPVIPGDSPELLRDRVLVVEHQLYPEVLQYLSQIVSSKADGEE